jgi:hypothetical protein
VTTVIPALSRNIPRDPTKQGTVPTCASLSRSESSGASSKALCYRQQRGDLVPDDVPQGFVVESEVRVSQHVTKAGDAPPLDLRSTAANVFKTSLATNSSIVRPCVRCWILFAASTISCRNSSQLRDTDGLAFNRRYSIRLERLAHDQPLRRTPSSTRTTF